MGIGFCGMSTAGAATTLRVVASGSESDETSYATSESMFPTLNGVVMALHKSVVFEVASFSWFTNDAVGKIRDTLYFPSWIRNVEYCGSMSCCRGLYYIIVVFGISQLPVQLWLFLRGKSTRPSRGPCLVGARAPRNRRGRPYS